MSMKTWPIISIYGPINKRTDCPHFSGKYNACADNMYKLCSPQRCLRIRGFLKAKSGQKKRTKEETQLLKLLYRYEKIGKKYPRRSA